MSAPPLPRTRVAGAPGRGRAGPAAGPGGTRAGAGDPGTSRPPEAA
ncbi:hypothetical protein [Nonomuraea sp. SBT364]|nr:hypothetical protein [Nonomuraea sp. SBT364]